MEAEQNVKTFQGMLVSRRYGISTMLIIIQVSCLWDTRRKTGLIRMEKLCDFCQAHYWVGPSQELRIPQPVPDPNNPDTI